MTSSTSADVYKRQELNRRLCADLFKSYPDQWERIGHMAIIAYGQVHMANLCVAMSFSVNGVSQLHGKICLLYTSTGGTGAEWRRKPPRSADLRDGLARGRQGGG